VVYPVSTSQVCDLQLILDRHCDVATLTGRRACRQAGGRAGRQAGTQVPYCKQPGEAKGTRACLPLSCCTSTHLLVMNAATVDPHSARSVFLRVRAVRHSSVQVTTLRAGGRQL